MRVSDWGIARTHLSAQRHAAHARQVHIQQHQIEAPLCAQFKPLLGILGQPHPVAVTLQQPAHHLAVKRHVLHHQNVQRRLPAAVAGSASAGSIKVELEPEATALPRLRTPMLPPICSTRCLQIASPRPVPP
jgi:hypothetical protein